MVTLLISRWETFLKVIKLKNNSINDILYLYEDNCTQCKQAVRLYLVSIGRVIHIHIEGLPKTSMTRIYINV